MMEEEEEVAMAMKMNRNWADLPSEIFLLILKNLSDICDFIRSRAVCKPWRFSSSVSDFPRQFPWIISFSEEPNLELYSIAFKKLYTIRARCRSGKKSFGAAGGYLLNKEKGNACSFSLLNPLNNREVHLPVLYHLFPYNFSWFSPTSFQSDDYVLANDYDKLVLCKPGDDRWDIIGPHEHMSRITCYYMKGLLFKFDHQYGVTKVMDISTHKELYIIQPIKYDINHKMTIRDTYLVESCGEILAVKYFQSLLKREYEFYIYRLEFGKGKENPYWVKLNSIGDRILFFNIPSGTAHSFSLRASDYAGFRGNMIYFIMNKLFHIYRDYVINMYDIESGETIFIDNPFDKEKEITWFIPTLNHI